MTLPSGRIYRSTFMLFIILTMAGCKSGCKVTEKPSPTPDPVQLTGSGDSYVEITAVATGPVGNGPCKDGMIIAAAGDGTQQLLMGNVQAPLPASYDLAGWSGGTWAKRGSGSIPPPPTGSTEAPEGSDNQTARLANGDLLVMWNGSTRSLLPNSADLPWWDNWGPTPNDIPQFANKVWPPAFPRAGYRGAEVFWRYSCDQGKWLATTMLDGGLAKALPPPPAQNPVQNKDGKSKPLAEAGYCVASPPWVKGFDRPELYVDPWGVDLSDPSKQRIFVSNRCSRFDDDSTQVFASGDSGASWNPSGIRLGAGTPVVMTATKAHLFMFQPGNSTPTLHWSDDHGASLASPPGGYDITYVVPNPKPGEQASYPLDWLWNSPTKVGKWGTASLSLARAGVNAIIAVYPAIEKVKTGPGEISRQVAAVVCVIPKGPGEAPIVIPIKIIRAQTGLGNVLMPTFIEDDRPDAKHQTSLLYWLETSTSPANENDAVPMSARYMVFNGILPGEEKLLSAEGGWETKVVGRYKVMGDYMKGSFYFHDNTLNFVAVWPQVPSSATAKDRTQAFIRILSFAADVEPPPQPSAPDKMAGAKPAPHAIAARSPRPRPTPEGKP